MPSLISSTERKQRKPRFSLRTLLVAVVCGSIGLLSYNLFVFTPQQSTYMTAESNTRAARKRKQKACKRMGSVRDIQDCVPPQLVRPLPSPHCDTVEDWDSVQRCLTGRFYAEDDTGEEDPFTIHIVGERHSGTKFVMHELQQCFHHHTAHHHVLKVHRDFLRVKHFFQPYRGENHLRSIVVVIVRDPVEWVAAMHEMPYHSPAHVKSLTTVGGGGAEAEESNKQHGGGVEPLPWQDFVSRPWTIKRSQADQVLQQQQQRKQRAAPVACQEHFRFDEVVPCQMDNVSYPMIPPDKLRGMSPLYELRRDGSGKPYDHILQLRADKISNFVLQLPMLFSLGGFVLVRYEDLLQKGSSFLLKQVADIVGMDDLPDECKASKPQPERLSQRYIPSGLKKWVEEHLDVEREKLLGYR